VCVSLQGRRTYLRLSLCVCVQAICVCRFKGGAPTPGFHAASVAAFKKMATKKYDQQTRAWSAAPPPLSLSPSPPLYPSTPLPLYHSTFEKVLATFLSVVCFRNPRH
jgi:hypothetical protein